LSPLSPSFPLSLSPSFSPSLHPCPPPLPLRSCRQKPLSLPPSLPPSLSTSSPSPRLSLSLSQDHTAPCSLTDELGVPGCPGRPSQRVLSSSPPLPRRNSG